MKYVYTLKAQRKGVAKFGQPVPATANVAELVSQGFAQPAAADDKPEAKPEAKPEVEDASMSDRGRKR